MSGYLDTSRPGLERSGAFNAAGIGLALFAVAYYLVKTRGPWAGSLASLCYGLFVLGGSCMEHLSGLVRSSRR